VPDQYVKKGIHRSRGAQATSKGVLTQLSGLEEPVLEKYERVPTPSGIPQYRVFGTKHFSAVVNSKGTNGKGHTWAQALASGLMELVERYSGKGHLRALRRARRQTVMDLADTDHLGFDDVLSSCFDPPTLTLSDEELSHVPLTWFEGRTLGGDTILLPEWVNRNIAHGQGTNGWAAGSTLDEALLQAVCEIAERHCNALVRYQRIRTPRIEPATIESPMVRGLIRRFESLGQTVDVRDFSLDTDLPVFGVFRRLPDGMVQMNTGVAPWRDEALARALTESSQGERNSACLPEDEAAPLVGHDGTRQFTHMPSLEGGSLRDELDRFARRVARLHWKVSYIDTTNPTIGIPTVIVDISGAKCRLDEVLNRPLIAAILADHMMVKDFESAQRYVAIGLDRDPDNEPLYRYYGGQLALLRGDIKTAIDDLRVVYDAFSALPDLPIHLGASKVALQAARMIGLCYQKMGDMDTALEWFARIWPALVNEGRPDSLP
jgi:ribosomal protein S12 methylthiotransferase accessory factor